MQTENPAWKSSSDIDVKQFKLVLMLPLRLEGLTFDEAASAFNKENTTWQEFDDLLLASDDQTKVGLASNEDDRYAEFVYFHPYINQFLYPKASSNAEVKKTWPLRIWQHQQNKQLKVRMAKGQWGEPFEVCFDVARCQIKLFSVGIAFLVVELSLNPHLQAQPFKLSHALDTVDFLRRTYPGYWAGRPEGGRYPSYREWFDKGNTLLVSPPISGSNKTDALERQKNEFKQEVFTHRRFPLDSIYASLLSPLAGHYVQVEDERIPHLAYISVDDTREITKGDWVRLGFADYHGDSKKSPYSPQFLKDFDANHCYDRWWSSDKSDDHGSGDNDITFNTRFLNVGYGFAAVGSSDFFNTVIANDFRRLHTQMALLAHFNKAALLVFSTRLSGSVTLQAVARQIEVKKILEDLLDFTNRHWFNGVSNQLQGGELYAYWHKHLDLEGLYLDVLREAKEANDFLERNSDQRQTKGIERLTQYGLAFASMSLIIAAISLLVSAGFPFDKPLSLLLDDVKPNCLGKDECRVIWHRLIMVVTALVVGCFVCWKWSPPLWQSIRCLKTQKAKT